jgi:4-alpha-glucanotransferase
MIPDQNAIGTFEASRIDWGRVTSAEGRAWLGFTKALLALRHARIVPHLAGAGGNAGRILLAPLEKLPRLKAPKGAQCYLPDNGRSWGIALQLYQLRSDRNWGIGDFADLADMARIAGQAGADFLGLNPLHALFEALSAYMVAQGHGAGWLDWPQDWQDAEGRDVRHFATAHDEEIRFHLWLQYLCRQQLDEVRRVCTKDGMQIGLYLDFAVGEAADGSGSWGSAHVLANVRIGAPPDAYNDQGQDWGLAPLSPLAMAREKAAPFGSLIGDTGAQTQERTRQIERADLLKDLRATGWLSREEAVTITPDNAPDALIRAAHAHLVQAPSRLFAARLEDLAGAVEPVNVPATVDEYPNWRHKLALPLDRLAQTPLFRDTVTALRNARPRSRQ